LRICAFAVPDAPARAPAQLLQHQEERKLRMRSKNRRERKAVKGGEDEEIACQKRPRKILLTWEKMVLQKK
jgi:hypothetical protein